MTNLEPGKEFLVEAKTKMILVPSITLDDRQNKISFFVLSYGLEDMTDPIQA